MKILNVKIENFGKLSKYTHDFSKNISVINQKNGWGKSTLSAFIKAMFFGLVGNSRINIDANDRKKFAPWQGGVFGGSLDFEFNNRQYRIKRFFEGTQSKDSFEFIDLKTNKQVERYLQSGKKIDDGGLCFGEDLFNLNVEAFERTIYISNKTLALKDKESVTEKLTNLIGNTSDKNNLATAISAIEKYGKDISRTHGKSGKLPDTENALREIEIGIENSERHLLDVEANKKKIEEIKQQIAGNEVALKDVKAKLAKVQEIAKGQALKENLAQLKTRVADAEQNLKTVQKFFKSKQPNSQEIERVRYLTDEIGKKESQISSVNNFNESGFSEKELTRFFAKGLPSEEEIKMALDLNNQVNIAKHELQKLVNQAEQQSKPTKASKKGVAMFSIFAGLLGIIALVVGIVLMQSSATNVAGMVLIGVGVVAGVLLVLFKDKFSLSDAGLDEVVVTNNDAEVKALQVKFVKNKQKLDNFLFRFYDSEQSENYSYAINHVQTSLVNYNRLADFNQKRSVSLANIEKEKKVLVEEIERLLANYDLDHVDSYSLAVQTINKYSAQYSTEQKLLEERQKDLQMAMQQSDQLQNIADKNESFDYEELSAMQENLTSELNGLVEEKTKLEMKNMQLAVFVERLPDLLTEKDELQLRIKELDKKLGIVVSANNFLKQAQDNITSKYLAPMQNSFKKFANIVLSDDLGEFSLDTDLKLKLEHNGKSYESDYFSSGYQDVFEFAIRLALADALFESDKPFLILDDPFMSLDPKKMEYALKLVKTLSGSFQVIYLTCHDSRAQVS